MSPRSRFVARRRRMFYLVAAIVSIVLLGPMGAVISLDLVARQWIGAAAGIAGVALLLFVLYGCLRRLRPGITHWGIKYGVYFNSEEEATAAIPDLVRDDSARWFVFGCDCDRSSWAARLSHRR